MRFLALCILSFVVAQKGICQYQSFFGKTSTSWNSVGSGLNRVNEWTDSIAYEKDTVLAGMTYKKVTLWRGYPENTYQSHFFCREDTTTGKLWRRYAQDSVEKLIADLSLDVGGQFLHPITSLPKTVDSVYYIYSRKHVRFNSSLLSLPLVFIEGVGPSYGILFRSVLLCQYKDGSPNYVLNVPPYPGVCNVQQLTSVEDPSEVSVNIFPNPTTGIVKIETQKTVVNLFVYVHDAVGRQLLLKNCISGAGCEINLRQFSPGLYTLTIKGSDNLVLNHQKILLN